MKKFADFKRVNQFDLPEIVDPERICVCFEIPNEKNHIRAFWTALYKLTIWNTWATDEAHTAREVAQVWRDVWNKAIGDEDTMGCGCSEKPTLRRITPNGLLEVSFDDGQTWQPDKVNDPRFSNPTLPPLTSGTSHERRCQTANSIVTALEEEQQKQLDILQGQANLATSIFDSIAAFLAIVGATGVGALFALISLLIGLLVRTIISMIPEDFEAQFTLTTWQTLVCIIYCEMDEDANISESAWQTIKQRALTEVPTAYAGNWCSDMINAMGVVGLTNAGRAGYGGSRDCTTCDCDETWCFEFNFVTDDYDFEATFGQWTLGQGWVGTSAGTGKSISIHKAHSMTTITHLEADVTFNPRGNLNFSIGTTGVLTANNVLSNTYTWDGSVTDDDITFNPSAGASQGNSVILTRVLLRGTGVNPFGEDNCE